MVDANGVALAALHGGLHRSFQKTLDAEQARIASPEADVDRLRGESQRVPGMETELQEIKLLLAPAPTH